MSVTNLVYRIAADSSPFAKELKSAESDVSRFQRRATSNVAKVGKAFAALGTASATALAVVVRQSINAADETAKMSQRIGVSVEDISAMSYALELSGASAASFERSVLRVSRATLDVSRGGSAATKSMENYGISLLDTEGNARDTMDVLMDMSDVFAAMPDGMEKSALAQEWLGKSGKDLIPLMNAGRDGIAEMTAEADSFGQVLSTEAAQGAERFNDNMTRLTKVGRGFANQVMTQSLPLLEGLTNRLVATANDSNKLAEATEFVINGLKVAATTAEVTITAFRAAGMAVGATAAFIVESSDVMIARMTIVQRTLGSMAKAIYSFSRGNFSDAADAVKEGMSALENVASGSLDNQLQIFKTAYGDIKELIDQSSKDIVDIWIGSAPVVEATAKANTKAMLDAYRKQAEVAEEARKKREESQKREATAYASAQDIIRKAQEDSQREQEKFIDDLERRAKRVYADTRTEMERYGEAIANLDELLQYGKISLETYETAVLQLNDGLSELPSALKEMEQQAKETGLTLEAFAVTGASSLFDSFATALFDPMNASFEDMVSNFIGALGRMAMEAAKQMVIQSLLTAMTGGIAGPATAVLGLASGGPVVGPGTSTSDSIPARLSNGEFVMNAKSVSKYGMGFMDAINRMQFPASPARFAQGGAVSTSAPHSEVKVVVLNAHTEDQIEQYLMSNRGARVVYNTMKKYNAA